MYYDELERALEQEFFGEDLKFVTHPGPHHRDELAAYAILELVFGRLSLVRTRDKDEIQNLIGKGFIVDTGQVYDHDKRMYDHHQKDKPLRDNGNPYSSVGLIWKWYGWKLVSDEVEVADNERIAYIWKKLDEVIEIWDCIDNGVPVKIHPGTILPTVGVYNPIDGDISQNMAFNAASVHMKSVILRLIKFNDWKYSCKEMVESSPVEGNILHLPKFLPGWQEFVKDMPEVEFVTFKGDDGNYRLQCVPGEEAFSFRNPDGIPEKFRGLPKESLPEGVIFVHNNGFIAVGETRKAVENLLI